MKKLTVRLTVVKKKKGVRTARYVTVADPKTETMACVGTEFFRKIHDFVAAVEELLGNDWEHTKYQSTGMEYPQTLLEPGGPSIGMKHTAFLNSYEELKEQLCKKQVRVVVHGPYGDLVDKCDLKPH